MQQAQVIQHAHLMQQRLLDVGLVVISDLEIRPWLPCWTLPKQFEGKTFLLNQKSSMLEVMPYFEVSVKLLNQCYPFVNLLVLQSNRH